MPIIPEIQDRLRLAYPASSDSQLFRAVQEGAYLADHLFVGESFLNNDVGRDIRGHVRRVGIAHQIDLYCTRGDLPFVTSMSQMPHGRWHWLEILSTGAMAHVCRTDDVYSFPDEAESRQDVRLVLQKDLFTTSAASAPLEKLIREVPKLYAWLTFKIGQDGRVSHLCWASPAADADDWIAHVNVLDEIQKRGEETPEIAATPNPKDRLKLKDHIAQALDEANDPKKSGE